MPPIGVVLGGGDFTSRFITLRQTAYPSLEAAKAAGAATINYGVFINSVIDFLIVAAVIFVMVKPVNQMKRRPEPAPVVPTTKACPYGISTIPIKAIRCPHKH